MSRWLALLLAPAILSACSPEPQANVRSEQPQRIVSLAPNLTELLFAAGAGDRVVAVSAWSDYPAEVLELPVIGDAFAVDAEQLRLIDPDLIVAWQSGTPSSTVDALRRQGYRVEVIRTRGLAEIAEALRKLGRLAGDPAVAEQAAGQFEADMQDLRAGYSRQQAVSVFYQVAARPLYTVNREHYVSELIEICGGVNVFADLASLAPTVDVEAVLDRDPEVMLASTDGGDNAFDEWQRWPALRALRYGNQFLLPADEIGRATPRLVIAARAMCLALQQARNNRAAAAH